jgi:DNA-binding NarL/FixJ family response regulator
VQAQSVPELKACIEKTNFDVLVTELVFTPSLPDVGWLSEVKFAQPELRIAVYSSLDNVFVIRNLFQKRVQGFVSKSCHPITVVECIMSLVLGDTYLASQHSTTCQVIADDSSKGTDRSFKLTPREQQIVERLSLGLNSREISKDLCISRRSVETYRSKLLQKMKVKNTGELMAFIGRTGITLL